MQLNQNHLPNYLNNQKKANKISGFYWLNSEDNYLLFDAAKQIKESLQSHGFNQDCERIIFHIDNTADWLLIKNSVQTPGLFNFSQKQLLEIHFIDKITSEEQQELINIAELLEQNTQTVCLVFYPYRIESQVLKQKWMASLDKLGVIITIWPPSINEYPKLLQRLIQQSQITFADNAIFDYFCQKTMCNPAIAAQTLYKLKLQDITRIDQTNKNLFLSTLSEHANYDIFDLVNSYLLGNLKQSLIILKVLKDHDTEPLLILWALRKELYMIGEILEQAKANGTSVQHALQKLNLWAAKQNIISAALGNFNLELVYKTLQRISQLEVIVKTENNPGFIWQQTYELLVLKRVELVRV